MNNAQLTAILKIQQAYKENCKEYAEYVSSDYCSFVVKRNEAMPEDENITVVWTKISGLSDNLTPETKIVNLLIDTTGRFYDMMMMPSIFQSETQVVNYLQKLTNFQWDAK